LAGRRSYSNRLERTVTRLPPQLRRLEAEAIGIMREVAAEFRRPVMLYSIGKDSSVMLHIALKAFFPARPPFPLLHVDTLWKFRMSTPGVGSPATILAAASTRRVHFRKRGMERWKNWSRY
jgi:sulfate adenylyltransferase subunit 2